MKSKILTAIKKRLSLLIGVMLGLVAGYLYYRLVGCASGACAITSNPIVSTLYGGVLGGLIGSVLTCGGCRSCAVKKCEESKHE